MKRIFTLLLSAVLMLMLFTGCSESGQSQASAGSVPDASSASGSIEEITIQLGHSGAEIEDNMHQKMALLFAQYVSELSDGTMTIEIIGNGQLGGERDMVEGMQLGTIEMASTANMVLSNFMPEFAVLDLPYLYNDYETAYKVLDSAEMQEVIEKFASEQGVRILAYGQGGFRQVVGDTSVNSVADIRNMKIRVPESAIYFDMFNALGASPTPLAWGETFTGLQQGTIDAFESVPAVVLNNGFHEVCSNISMTNHQFSPNPLMISESLFQSLSQAQQDVLVEAAKRAAPEQRAWLEAGTEEVMKKLEENGMVINEPDLTEFQAAVEQAGLYEKYKEIIGTELVENIQALCN